MRTKAWLSAGALLALIGVAACDGGAPGEGAMEGIERGGGAAGDRREHVAEGTLNSIDQAAGTVNITHDPVQSAGWPAMTMNFKLADPDAAADLSPGEQIEFQFAIDGGDATITRITAR